ncbi:hypothetical protein LWI28_009199 [Acer negundo]|uniref:Uncharacterized protein n=1 Tax=Acer negundo TaxID=4023 RepID=A0AAD5J9F8_ACENE|nr:hypothetical protein LWI28_009199 [Acer negundo]
MRERVKRKREKVREKENRKNRPVRRTSPLLPLSSNPSNLSRPLHLTPSLDLSSNPSLSVVESARPLVESATLGRRRRHRHRHRHPHSSIFKSDSV